MKNVELFEVKGATATPIVVQAGMGLVETKGRVEPTGNEVVTIPPPRGFFAKFQARRITLYPENSCTAWPIAQPVEIPPESLTVNDALNLYGPYWSGMMQRAMRIGQNMIDSLLKWQPKDWIMLGFHVVNLGLLASILGICIKAFKEAGLL